VISAPGKILWIGSYSVVFGGISHVIAIDRRVTCESSRSTSMIFETSYGTFFEKGNDLIESVLEVLRTHYSEIPNLRVKLRNHPDFQVEGRKTGLGSSSAATVALVGCITLEVEGKLDIEKIYRFSQEANYMRQKGIGSGFDIAAAVYGSVIYRRFRDLNKMDSYVEPLRLPIGLRIILGFTGKSSGTVALVKKFIDSSNKVRFKELMEEIEADNEMAIKLLKMGRLDEATVHIRLARKNLNMLAEEVVGVELEGEEERKLMKMAEESGAIIALMPGAGGGDVIFALAEDKIDVIRKRWEERGLKTMEVKDDEGLRVEDGS
jgi:phosphomevalonate kinase